MQNILSADWASKLFAKHTCDFVGLSFGSLYNNWNCKRLFCKVFLLISSINESINLAKNYRFIRNSYSSFIDADIREWFVYEIVLEIFIFLINERHTYLGIV